MPRGALKNLINCSKYNMSRTRNGDPKVKDLDHGELVLPPGELKKMQTLSSIWLRPLEKTNIFPVVIDSL